MTYTCPTCLMELEFSWDPLFPLGKFVELHVRYAHLNEVLA